GVVRGRCRPVHAADGGNRRGTAEADVPGAAADPARAAAQVFAQRQGRPAGHGLCACRSCRRVAAGAAGEAAVMEAPVVTTHALSLRYRGKVALQGVDLELPAGCMTGLIGPDGVGKSSLLALIAGARAVQEGQIQVLGG